MIDLDQPVITPVKGKRSPKLGSRAIITSSRADLKAIKSLLDFPESAIRPLFHGDLFFTENYCLAGPSIGAPQASMILETLIAWGAEQLIYVGWCGSLVDSVDIGDIIFPTGAFIDEGTSLHYPEPSDRSFPSEQLLEVFRRLAHDQNTPHKEGMVWTTDAIFRETPQKIIMNREEGALVVDMEASALFTVGRHHGVQVSALLAVSDELATFDWQPGFKDQRFLSARKNIFQLIRAFCMAP
jgi:purine-nucleoside phosphorylase